VDAFVPRETTRDPPRFKGANKKDDVGGRKKKPEGIIPLLEKCTMAKRREEKSEKRVG